MTDKCDNISGISKCSKHTHTHTFGMVCVLLRVGKKSSVFSSTKGGQGPGWLESEGSKVVTEGLPR